MLHHSRYGLATWPSSQDLMDNEECLLVNPPEGTEDTLDQAYLVPEDITGPLDPDSAYLRIPWPEAQDWDEAPDGWDSEDVLHDYNTQDAYVLESLYVETLANK